jgi:capsular polysaccharide transport system ATP-binding protein
MIHLINVSKAYAGPSGPRHILRPISLTIPANRQVALLGYNGAGKSTFLKLIAGVEMPDKGRIVRTTRVSWPLGFSGGLHKELTGVENAAFVARIYGADVDKVIRFVYDFSEIGDYMHMPVRTYSSGMRGRLNFGLSMAIDFDFYLVDEITGVGDRSFQNKCKKAFAARAQTSGLLYVSHNDASVRAYCDIALVLHDGRLYAFEDLAWARTFYRGLAQNRTAQTLIG